MGSPGSTRKTNHSKECLSACSHHGGGKQGPTEAVAGRGRQRAQTGEASQEVKRSTK